MANFSIFQRKGNRSTARRRRARLRPVEVLEGRQLLSTTYTVTVASDYVPNSGAAPIVDSLRWAITQADSHSGSVIKFDIGKLGTTQTINLLAPLPAITVPMTIDGTSQLGLNGDAPGVVLNGSRAGSSANGIVLQASNSVIRGLVIQDFGGDGVLLDGGSGDHGDILSGDDIGTNVTGSSAMGNRGSGVVLEDGASDNTIGGTSASARDVISGNLNDGVDLFSSSKDNRIEGDFIGVDATGEHALGNTGIGVAMNTASHNTVGGSTLGSGNVISGNGSIGVRLRDGNTSGMTDNVVEGNLIGTDAAGLVAIGNLSNGVVIDFGANGNTIGGSWSADRNVIAGNDGDGVYLSTGDSDQPVSNNVIQGNAIGTNAPGTAVLPNQGNGVSIDGSSHNTISGNTIAGNALDGVHIQDTDPITTNSTGQSVSRLFISSDNVVEGNVIGGSSRAFGNLGYGVDLESASTGNTIGGTTSGDGNVISNNAESGVFLSSGVGANNLIDHDVIDSNGGSGVYLYYVSDATTVENSTIELNAVYGIWMRHSVKLNTGTDIVTKNVKGQIETTSN